MVAATTNQNVENSQEVLRNILDSQKGVQQLLQTSKAVQKDAIITAQEKDLIKMSYEKPSAQKPALAAPSSNFTGTIPPEQESLIALISIVLVLQAKVSSQNWSTFWKSTTESMQAEVKFAPIIGKAIRYAADAQSDATKAESTQAYISGGLNLFGFVASVGVGALAYAGEEDAADGATNLDKEKPPAGELDSLDKEEQTSELSKLTKGNTDEESNGLDNAARKETDKENNTILGRLKKKLGSSQPGIVKFNKIYGHISGSVQLATMLTQVGDGFVKGHYQSIVATKQAEQGQFQALSQESQQYAQFYGKAFGLNQSLADTASRGVQSAMDIYKSAVDQITNTVTSMFRG